jgi:hypothetical protein
MAETSWFQLLTAALGGGVTVKVLDILYQEFRHRSEHSQTAKRFVDNHLDPLLKAADELVGKLRSLAESDFEDLHDIDAGAETLEAPHFSSLLFLFGRFWARMEIIRQEGLSVAMSQDKRGKQLQNFLDCLESRRVRVVDRISQRAVGEVLLARQNGNLGTIGFIEFVKIYESDAQTRRWMTSLVRVLSRTRHTRDRQRLLQYGAVVHALVDTLDPKHLVTRDRPSYPNKLTRRSRNDLKFRVFDLYLPFVRTSRKYLGPPKK